MKDLLEFIVHGITGSDDFSIDESQDDNQLNLDIKAKSDLIGIIIGKNGKTIKAIRNLVRVRAVLKKKTVFITVSES